MEDGRIYNKYFERKPEYCIYKISQNLRKMNIEAYTPQMVSIGLGKNGKSERKIQKRFRPKNKSDSEFGGELQNIYKKLKCKNLFFL